MHPTPTTLEQRLKSFEGLLEVALRLSSVHQLDPLLEAVTSGACQALNCSRASLFLLDANTNELYTRVATELEINEIRFPGTAGLTGWVATHRQPANVPVPSADSRWSGLWDKTTGFQTRNLLAVPVISATSDRLLGVLQVLNKESDSFHEFDEQLLLAFAAHAATAIERQQLQATAHTVQQLQQAMQLARQIQSGFLPKVRPDIPGFELASWWQPAEYVSGDYYDWQRLADGRVAVVIGDVCGHGLGASLLMASARAMFHALARTQSDPLQLLETLRETLVPDLADGRFLTFFVLALDPRRATIQFANAGQQPVLHYHAQSGTVERLPTTCLPIGFPPVNLGPNQEEVSLGHGDLLLLGTDGIVEAMNDAGEQFGTNRLCRLIVAHAANSAETLTQELQRELIAFTGCRELLDDATAVVLRRSR